MHQGISVIAALVGSGLILWSGTGKDNGIQDWEPLNLQIAEVLGGNEVSEGLKSEGKTETRSSPVAATSSEEGSPQVIIDHSTSSETKSVVTIPEQKVETTVTTESITPNTKQESSNVLKINVNTAGAAELTNLPGIGEKKAQAILEYRNLKGPFRKVSDLLNVKGIGTKMLQKIAPHVEL
jgi:competence protein ComEA